MKYDKDKRGVSEREPRERKVLISDVIVVFHVT